MSNPYEYVDANDKELKVDQRVRIFGFNPNTDDANEMHGRITGFTDPDGDVDDEGRSIGINPTVTIHFDDDVEDTFTMRWTAEGWWDEDAPFKCEDIEVI